MAKQADRRVHGAVIRNHPDGPIWFGSLDGQAYIGTSREPLAEDTDAIDRLMNPQGLEDTVPMRIDRSFLEERGAEFWIPGEDLDA